MQRSLGHRLSMSTTKMESVPRKKANSEMKLANIKEFYPRLLCQLSSKQIAFHPVFVRIKYPNRKHLSFKHVLMSALR